MVLIRYIKWHDDGEDQLTGVISTASFGSPGKMALAFKKSGKAPKRPDAILEVQLRHGDVATMCDTRLQALTDVSYLTFSIKIGVTSTDSNTSTLSSQTAFVAMP